MYIKVNGFDLGKTLFTLDNQAVNGECIIRGFAINTGMSDNEFIVVPIIECEEKICKSDLKR